MTLLCMWGIRYHSNGVVDRWSRNYELDSEITCLQPRFRGLVTDWKEELGQIVSRSRKYPEGCDSRRRSTRGRQFGALGPTRGRGALERRPGQRGQKHERYDRQRKEEHHSDRGLDARQSERDLSVSIVTDSISRAFLIRRRFSSQLQDGMVMQQSLREREKEFIMQPVRGYRVVPAQVEVEVVAYVSTHLQVKIAISKACQNYFKRSRKWTNESTQVRRFKK